MLLSPFGSITTNDSEIIDYRIKKKKGRPKKNRLIVDEYGLFIRKY